MHQYVALKTANTEHLLFYRMGDFYELFFEDAVVASKALNLFLTKRGTYKGKDIPMCGVPAHSSNSYLLKLIKAGFSVAICEQLETPQEAKKRGHSALVRRDVVRIITPGTIIEDELLDSKSNNYLCSIYKEKDLCSAAFSDLSTGEFRVLTCPAAEIENLISQIGIVELLIPDSLKSNFEKWNITIRNASMFDLNRAKSTICDIFGDFILEDQFSQAELISIGSLLE